MEKRTKDFMALKKLFTNQTEENPSIQTTKEQNLLMVARLLSIPSDLIGDIQQFGLGSLVFGRHAIYRDMLKYGIHTAIPFQLTSRCWVLARISTNLARIEPLWDYKHTSTISGPTSERRNLRLIYISGKLRR